MTINAELEEILHQEGFIEGEPEDDEIIYELKHSLDDRIGILIYTGFSESDSESLYPNKACKIVLFDYSKQRAIGRSTRVRLNLPNWKQRLIFEIDKFIDIITSKRWKKCIKCGEPMRFLPTPSGDFWGCNGYESLGVGCQNKEAYDPATRIDRHRSNAEQDQEAGGTKTRFRMPRAVTNRSTFER